MRDETLKIAIQRSGRLSEGSIDLLRRAGIHFENGAGKLKSTASNFPLEILQDRGRLSLTIDAYLHEPNVLALRIRRARAGALPVPLAQVLDGMRLVLAEVEVGE